MLKVGYMKERLKMKDKELNRVEWYNEELDKFYETVQWLKTEEERERQIKLYKRSDER